MYQISLNDEVPLERFKDYLKEGSHLYLNYDFLIKKRDEIEIIRDIRRKQLSGLVFAATSHRYKVVSKHNLIDYFLQQGVPAKTFVPPGGNFPNSYNQKVRDKLIRDGFVDDAFILYEEITKHNSQLSAINKLSVRAYERTGKLGNMGETLQRINYQVNPNKNLRFSTAKENVIGFTGAMQEAISAPEGMYILSCDFPQIDARVAVNMYFKNNKIREIMEEVDDTYLVFKEFARWIQYEADKIELARLNSLHYYTQADAIEDRIKKYNPAIQPFHSKEQRDIYKVTALSSVYYGRWSPFKELQASMAMLGKMYESTERYKRMLNLSKFLFQSRIPIKTSSRWGNSKRVIIERNIRETLSSVFNSGVQSTSSEIVISYITRFLDYFRNLGYGPEEVRICVNRHDEPVFYISKELFHEHISFIASMRTVLVEGWVPFDLELFVGHSYKKNDEYAKSLLERIPSTKEKAREVAKKYQDIVEPYPLLEPFIVHGAYKIVGNSVRLALVWNDGDIPNGLNFDSNYSDKRNLEVKVRTTPIITDTKNAVLTIVNQLTSTLDKRDIVLLVSGIRDEDVGLDNATLYLRGVDTSENIAIANGVLASIAKSKGEELSHQEENYLKYLNDNVARINKG